VRDKEIRKFYLCEIEGEVKPEKGEIHGWLIKDGKTRKMVFSDNQTKDATECLTRYRVLKTGAVSTVEAELLTGRTHQIRASFSYIGHPLVGDVKYGAKKTEEKDFQHLVSYRLIFDFSTDSGCLDYLKGREIKL
jgi:23S rRNA pseudouridine955/2504/2580 synthase